MTPDKKTRTDGRAMLNKVLVAGSSKITVTNDSVNNHISLDVASASISHTAISDIGTNTHSQIDTALSTLGTRNAANGYAGLNATSRIIKGVDSTDDLIVDSTTTGFVLKDTNGHYWRVTVSVGGVLQTADLGTSKP